MLKHACLFTSMSVATVAIISIGAFLSQGNSFAQSVTDSIFSESVESINFLGEDYAVVKSARDDALPETGTGNGEGTENSDDGEQADTGLGAAIPQDLLLSDEQNVPLFAIQYGRQHGTVHGIPISFSSVVHEYSVEEYSQALDCMPDNLLRALADKGWSIHITDKAIEDEFPFVSVTKDIEDVGGLCWIPDKEIWVLSSLSPRSLIHEIGHAADWECGGASARGEWLDVMSALKDVADENRTMREALEPTTFGRLYVTTACNDITSRQRFFEQYAQAFYYYWVSPAKLVSECPEAYKYFAERFGVVNDSDSPVETYAAIMQDAYAEGENRKQNPVLSIDVDDVMEPSYLDGLQFGNTGKSAKHALTVLRIMSDALGEQMAIESTNRNYQV